MTTSKAYYESPLGKLILTAEGEYLTGLYFEGQKHLPQITARETSLPIFDIAAKWLDLYFAGKEPGFTPPLKFNSTPFRELVWQKLLAIPYGRTVTYKKISELVADEKKIPPISPRAVGGAVSHNPIAVIVPCHRVIGANGDLKGYAGGTDKKIKLLQLEKSARG